MTTARQIPAWPAQASYRERFSLGPGERPGVSPKGRAIATEEQSDGVPWSMLTVHARETEKQPGLGIRRSLLFFGRSSPEWRCSHSNVNYEPYIRAARVCARAIQLCPSSTGQQTIVPWCELSETIRFGAFSVAATTGLVAQKWFEKRPQSCPRL